MFPIVALLISAVFENLVIDSHILFGAGIALAGNLLVLVGRSSADQGADKDGRTIGERLHTIASLTPRVLLQQAISTGDKKE